MPVLHERTDRTGYILVTTQEGREVAYALGPEAERFLMLVLGMKSGDACRVADLNLMVERGWATVIARDEEALRLREPEPVKKFQTVVPPEPTAVKPQKSANTEKANRTPATRRTRGREVALQLLYQLDQNPSIPAAEVEKFLQRRLSDPKLVVFTRGLIDGVQKHQARLDELIGEVAENWRLDRMATIDRNILRLGAYELLFCSDIPAKVAINEALELAKRYSTSQSSRFVNGLLDRLQTSSAEPKAAEAAVSAEKSGSAGNDGVE